MTQPREQRSRQRHGAIAGALPLTHGDEQTSAIDMLGFEPEPFTKPQPERVNRRQRHAPYRVPHQCQHLTDLQTAQDHGQALRDLHAQQVEHG